MLFFSTEIRPNLYIADGGLGDIKMFTTSTDYVLMKQKKLYEIIMQLQENFSSNLKQSFLEVPRL